MEERLPFIPPYTEIPHYGKVASVGFKDGERFYMMKDKHGFVTLMPGDLMTNYEKEFAVDRKETQISTVLFKQYQ